MDRAAMALDCSAVKVALRAAGVMVKLGMGALGWLG
jgi:hypothetical protein